MNLLSFRAHDERPLEQRDVCAQRNVSNHAGRLYRKSHSIVRIQEYKDGWGTVAANRPAEVRENSRVLHRSKFYCSVTLRSDKLLAFEDCTAQSTTICCVSYPMWPRRLSPSSEVILRPLEVSNLYHEW